MLQGIISKAVAAALALGAMTAAVPAGPLGLPQQQKAQREGTTPLAFGYDGAATLFTNTPNFALFLRLDQQGNLFALDPNNVVWVPISGLFVGQSSIGLAVGGLFYEPSGAYGAPLMYDGGFNTFILP